AHPRRWPRRVPRRSAVVHRLLPTGRHRVTEPGPTWIRPPAERTELAASAPTNQAGLAAPAPITRLDDVRMREVHLTTPVSEAAIASLELGDVVDVSGVLYTAREGVYRLVVDRGVPMPPSVCETTNVNFHCSPAAAVRPDGSYAVEAVTATAAFRFGEAMGRWVERSGGEGILGQAGVHERADAEWFVPDGAVYLTTIGYGMGAAYGQGIRRVREVHWLQELGIAQAMWVLEVERLGPFLVEGDRAGRSLFALANREIDLRLGEVYAGLPPYAMGRFGETPPGAGEVV